jgi:hypothetical protein
MQHALCLTTSCLFMMECAVRVFALFCTGAGGPCLLKLTCPSQVLEALQPLLQPYAAPAAASAPQAPTPTDGLELEDQLGGLPAADNKAAASKAAAPVHEVSASPSKPAPPAAQAPPPTSTAAGPPLVPLPQLAAAAAALSDLLGAPTLGELLKAARLLASSAGGSGLVEVTTSFTREFTGYDGKEWKQVRVQAYWVKGCPGLLDISPVTRKHVSALLLACFAGASKRTQASPTKAWNPSA